VLVLMPGYYGGAGDFTLDARELVKRVPGLQVWALDLPLYALQTDLTHGHVLRGARRFIAGSKVPRARSVLVDASATESHLDPLTAAPERNRFLQTVVPFLRKLQRSQP
jgi:hypothetical protein